MKKLFLLFLTACLLQCNFFAPKAKAQVNVQDSLALLALYNSTNGPNWFNSWNLNNNVDTWFGIYVINGRVVNIELFQNNLTGTLPPEIGNLDSLVILNIEMNQIGGYIPIEIGNLTMLKKMFLSANLFSGEIPIEIGNLTNLEELFLGGNNLTGSIPLEVVYLIKLRQLAFDNNFLTGTIPTEIASLGNLEWLLLDHNEFMGHIPPELCNLSHLAFLELQYNKFSGGVPSSFNNFVNNSLYHIYLNNNELTEYCNLQLSCFISISNNKLTFEDLENNISIPGTIHYNPQDSILNPIDTTIYIGQNISFSSLTGGTHNKYQWKKNNAILALNNVSLNDSGVYTCNLTNVSVPNIILTRKLIKLKVLDTTSNVFNNSKYELNTLVYPNPTIGSFILKSNFSGTTEIINPLCVLLRKFNHTAEIPIEVNDLPKGIYFIKRENARVIQTIKLIIK